MDMSTRIEELVRDLGLAPHPEGGYFTEIFRSDRAVMGGGGERSALTVIYFLLTGDSFSRWHRVTSDEVWHFCEGDPLVLAQFDGASDVQEHRLGPGVERALNVVPGGAWQTARTTGAYTLASCTVGPGFDFADFALMADHPDAAARLTELHPDLASYI
jgi:uncharacterized protein